MVFAWMIRFDNGYLSDFVAIEAQQFVAAEFISHCYSNFGHIVGGGSIQNPLLESLILLHFQDESLELIQGHKSVSLRRHFALS